MPLKPLHITCRCWQAGTGGSWKPKRQSNTSTWQQTQPATCARESKPSRSLLRPSVPPMCRMSPSSSVPDTYIYTGGKPTLFWTCLELCSSLSQTAKPKQAVSQGAEFHHCGHEGEQSKEHTQGAQQAAPVLGVKHHRYTHTDGLRPRKNWERKTTQHWERVAGRARMDCSSTYNPGSLAVSSAAQHAALLLITRYQEDPLIKNRALPTQLLHPWPPSPHKQLSAGWHQSRPQGHPGCRRCALS